MVFGRGVFGGNSFTRMEPSWIGLALLQKRPQRALQPVLPWKVSTISQRSAVWKKVSPESNHFLKIPTASLSPNPLLLLFSRSALSDSATPWTAARQASLSITISRSLLKLMSVESVMPSNHLILCHPLLLLLSIFSSIRVFSNESALHIRRPVYWSFSFSTSPSNEHLVLISFRMDWFNLLAVQGALKSLLSTTVQNHQLFGAQPSLWSNCHICT